MGSDKGIAGDVEDMMVLVIDDSSVIRPILDKKIPPPCHAEVEIVAAIDGVTEYADVGIGGTEAVGNQDLVSAPGNEAGGRGNSQAIGIAFA